MNRSSRININASSLVDLKAELFRKQEQAKKDHLQPSGSSAPSTTTKQTGSKKPNIWSKKNAGVAGRAERDLEQVAEERNKLDDARKRLEAKAKFYEKMTADDYIPEADSSEMFLVDFEKKAFDQKSEVKAGVQGPLERGETRQEEKRGDTPPPADPDEEWVDYTDTLGRSRRCMRRDLPELVSMDKQLNPQAFQEKEKQEAEKRKEDLPDLLSNDMYREMLRKKWEQEEEEAAKRPQGPTHYQNVKYDEVRDMGVGYFDFAKNQSKRNEQMETLQMLRDETTDQRQRREKLKQKRKAAMKARLEKVKERKRARGELVEDEEEEKEKEEGKEEQQKRGNEGAKPESERDQERVVKDTKVREWDIGKEPVSPWEQQLSSMRDERPAEFAPPTCYADPGPRKPQQRASFPPPRDYSSMYGNPKGKTGNKPSSASFPHSSPQCGMQDGTQPFAEGGVSNASGSRGIFGAPPSRGGGDPGGSQPPGKPWQGGGSSQHQSEDTITSALSFFRHNAGNKTSEGSVQFFNHNAGKK